MSTSTILVSRLLLTPSLNLTASHARRPLPTEPRPSIPPVSPEKLALRSRPASMPPGTISRPPSSSRRPLATCEPSLLRATGAIFCGQRYMAPLFQSPGQRAHVRRERSQWGSYAIAKGWTAAIIPRTIAKGTGTRVGTVDPGEDNQQGLYVAIYSLARSRAVRTVRAAWNCCCSTPLHCTRPAHWQYGGRRWTVPDRPACQPVAQSSAAVDEPLVRRRPDRDVAEAVAMPQLLLLTVCLPCLRFPGSVAFPPKHIAHCTLIIAFIQSDDSIPDP
ncbi:hypothetical protein EJ04DRAFT_519780 [Polyplosphaeria fusca]|uniref:Uncharacterized protein n=1 Tax=Polyplosphaeria fusca TaxID=682080 RepID=A0A9P4R9C8_9PLEO|nr:hypothetical protein EJ04DRAFT_519780 [Polyplosphaeria fusca]